MFEVIESIKAAARPAHFRRISMFLFVMAPQDCRHGSHGKSHSPHDAFLAVIRENQ